MALFKETTRSIKILLVGVNSVVLLVTIPIVLKMLEIRGSEGLSDEVIYRHMGGDTTLAAAIVFLPFTLFLIYLGIRFNHYIKNNPKLIIGVFVLNFLIFLGYQALNFENIGTTTYISLVLNIYILINIFRLAKEYKSPSVVQQ